LLRGLFTSKTKLSGSQIEPFEFGNELCGIQVESLRVSKPIKGPLRLHRVLNNYFPLIPEVLNLNSPA